MQVLFVFSVLLLAGCAASPAQHSNSIKDSVPMATSEVAPVVSLPPPAPPTGGLFQDNYGHFMFSDRRAYRLGDILTIELKGSTNISMQGGSKVSKNNKISLPDPTLLGKAGANILGNGRSLAFDINPSREYGGDTSASRANSLQGNIAVKVTDVLVNGTLRVTGEKWLTINSGRERILISGLVRPEDISTDNKVSSERLAEARIDYIAVGANGDAHQPGWGTRMLNSPWFPF